MIEQIERLNEIECGQLCQSTIDCLYRASGGLSNFPGLVKKIITNRAWERRVEKGRVIELDSFVQLVTAKPYQGWGEDLRKVESVIKDDPEALRLFREATTAEPHVHQAPDNDNVIITKGVQGNSLAYTLDRLHREAPELYEAVVAKEMSANAAAIKAGFRKVKTPLEMLWKAWERCSEEDRDSFRAGIQF
jgi:hypothetical protein